MSIITFVATKCDDYRDQSNCALYGNSQLTCFPFYYFSYPCTSLLFCLSSLSTLSLCIHFHYIYHNPSNNQCRVWLFLILTRYAIPWITLKRLRVFMLLTSWFRVYNYRGGDKSQKVTAWDYRKSRPPQTETTKGKTKQNRGPALLRTGWLT